MMTEERGLTKDNMKKLFKWEGRKELFWIFFIILVLFTSWGYQQDREKCKDAYDNPCYKQCLLNDYLKEAKEKYPELSFICDIETMSCTVTGIITNDAAQYFPKYNLTFNESKRG